MTLANIRLIPDMNSQQDLPSVHGPAPSRVYQLAPVAFCFMAKEIPLRNSSLKAIVDDCDYPLVCAYRWGLGHKGTCVETTMPNTGNVSIRLHRFLLGLVPHDGILVDHENMNPLDNRRQNLRIGTKGQNIVNSKRRAHKQSCTFKGVFPARDRWRVIVVSGGERLNIGSFATPEEAAKMYDIAALFEFGDFARTNFPREDYEVLK
jgi:hypothetical protein